MRAVGALAARGAKSDDASNDEAPACGPAWLAWKRGLSRASPRARARARPRPRAAAARRRRARGETLLEIGEATEEVVERKQLRPAREAHERHLQGCADLAALHDRPKPRESPVKEAREVVGVGLLREGEDVTDLLVREVEQLASRASVHTLATTTLRM